MLWLFAVQVRIQVTGAAVQRHGSRIVGIKQRLTLGPELAHPRDTHAEMTYDNELAHRIREQLADEHGVTEQSMFGGLAFMLDGNMAVGISNGGELMVRVGPDASDEALARPHTRIFDMTGRPMKGWILIAAEGFATKRQLGAWVRRGVAFARTLPAKG
jgi:TfoX/Sxy family transcriptional regulator of competence genes